MQYIGFRTKQTGIYKITNTINGKIYIGRTSNFNRRYVQYLYDFENQRSRSVNQHFLNSVNKYGLDNFEFEELYYCFTEDESLVLEIEFMNMYKSTNSEFGYNKRQDSEGGMIVSNETSLKISNRLKKEWRLGVRDGHSEKLKASWENRDRVKQSELFSKSLTKWYYVVNENYDNKLFYKDLVDIGLKNSIGKFSEKKSNKVVFKDFIIERFEYEDES